MSKYTRDYAIVSKVYRAYSPLTPQKLAEKEGWFLTHILRGAEEIGIERWDYAANKFGSDGEAYLYVLGRAEAGSEFHKACIELCKDQERLDEQA